MPLSSRGWFILGGESGSSEDVMPVITLVTRVVTEVPIMTSNTTPNGVVSASSYVNASYIDIWKAFRHSFTDDYDCWHSASATNQWLKYDAGIGNTLSINSYSIAPRRTGTETLNTWTLEGSNNDTDWDVLDSQADITTGWSRTSERCFALAALANYRYYRLNVASANGSYIVVGRLSLGIAVDIISSSMTSANTPSPEVVSGSSDGGANVAPWYAFVQRLGIIDDSSSNCWISEATTPISVGDPEWIKYDAGAGNVKTVTHFRLTGRITSISSVENAKDFILQGSNNDTDWTNLHSVVDLSLGYYQYSPTYEIVSTSAYRYHRILITESTSTSSQRVAASVIELLGS